MREMEDGEVGQLTVRNNIDNTESQRRQEENTASGDKENEQENGERGEKKYHVTNTCLEPLEMEGRKMPISRTAEKRRNHN